MNGVQQHIQSSFQLLNQDVLFRVLEIGDVLKKSSWYATFSLIKINLERSV